MTERKPAHTLDEGQQLIVRAFHQARVAGYPGWHQMRSAVLKNRLLDMTDRTFDERDWGAERFKDFLALFPSVVSVDVSKNPPIVELLAEHRLEHEAAEGSLPSRAASASRRQRVRADLWTAVIDFGGGVTYVWDADLGRAVAAESEADARPRLPAIDAPTFTEWRAAFATEQLKVAPTRRREAIERWLNEDGSAPLPSLVLGLWNAELKQRVTDRLVAWFNEQSLPVPEDVVQTTGHERTPTAPDAERLRALIHRTVDAMTAPELAALNLPAAAVLRSRADRRSD